MSSPTDPLAMLAPNATPDFVPPQPPATPTGTPTEATPPVTVSTAPPSQVDTVNSPQLTAMLDHESWLHRALNATASHLVGDQTYEITPNADGTGVRVTPRTATMGEKWGRLAATALVGAAKGLAAGQGPGGGARAVAAGFEQGAQMPQQQLANANAEAAQMNQQQLAAANNAFLHQKMVVAGLQAQQLGTTVAGEQADLMNGLFNAVKDSPNAQVLPSVGSMAEIAKLQNSYADFFKTHTNNTMKVFVTPDANGNVRFTPVIVDVAYNDRKNDKVAQALKLGVGENGEPILESDPIAVGAQTNGSIMAANQAKTAQFLEQHNKYMTASGANKPDRAITNPLDMQLQINKEQDPIKRKQMQDALDANQQRLVEIARESRPPAPSPGLPGGVYTPGSNPILDDTAEGLASGRYLESTLPKRTGKGQPTPQEQNYAANVVSQQKFGLPYSPTIIDQENKFATNTKTQAYLEGIDRMTGAHGDAGQLNQLIDLAQKAGIGENAPLNTIKQAIRTRLGNEAATNFATLLTETQSNLGTLIGNPLLGSGESDLKLRTAQHAFGQNPTLSSLRGQVATVTDVLNRSRQDMAANNRYIQQRYGTRLSPTPAPTPPAATGYKQGVNTPQFPIAQDAQGHKTQWNGQTWATLP